MVLWGLSGRQQVLSASPWEFNPVFPSRNEPMAGHGALGNLWVINLEEKAAPGHRLISLLDILWPKVLIFINFFISTLTLFSSGWAIDPGKSFEVTLLLIFRIGFLLAFPPPPMYLYLLFFGSD